MHYPENNNTRSNSILIIDDNPTDALLMKEAFAIAEIENEIHIVDDSSYALQLLKQQNSHPGIILLDLNMPKISGLEVLTEIKSDARLCFIPIIIFTSSDAPEDVKAVYDRNASAYVKKPGDFENYIKIAKSIKDFWLSTAIVYSRERQ